MDVLEILLANETGIWLNDKTTALSLAVLLRDALAELLGVRSDELSCDIKEVREEGEGRRRSMLLIFDRFAAGYASSADRTVAVSCVIDRPLAHPQMIFRARRPLRTRW